LYSDRAKDFEEVNRLIAPLNELLRRQRFIAGQAPAYSDYIVFGTLQMPRILNGVEVLSNQDAIVDWRDRMRLLFNGLADSPSSFDNSSESAAS
jgi:glutathione S-transferase